MSTQDNESYSARQKGQEEDLIDYSGICEVYRGEFPQTEDRPEDKRSEPPYKSKAEKRRNPKP